MGPCLKAVKTGPTSLCVQAPYAQGYEPHWIHPRERHCTHCNPHWFHACRTPMPRATSLTGSTRMSGTRETGSLAAAAGWRCVIMSWTQVSGVWVGWGANGA